MSTALAVKPVASGKTVAVVPQKRDLFEELEALSSRIRNHAFGLFEQRGSWDGGDLDDWFRAESELLTPISIETSESSERFTIRAKVPGFDAKDLTVRAAENSICIHGRTELKKEEKKNSAGGFTEVASELCRRIDLPDAIDPDKVSAHLANGVLELDLPKAAPPKKTEVKAA